MKKCLVGAKNYVSKLNPKEQKRSVRKKKTSTYWIVEF